MLYSVEKERFDAVNILEILRVIFKDYQDIYKAFDEQVNFFKIDLNSNLGVVDGFKTLNDDILNGKVDDEYEKQYIDFARKNIDEFRKFIKTNIAKETIKRNEEAEKDSLLEEENINFIF